MKYHLFINNLIISLIIIWLPSILLSQSNFNKNATSKFKSRYRVQICATTDKSAAIEQKQIAEEKFKTSGYLIYEEPFFKARLGDFSSVEDAKAFRLRVIREGYSGAWIVKSDAVAVAAESQVRDDKNQSSTDSSLIQKDTSRAITDLEDATKSKIKSTELKPKTESAIGAEANKERKSVWAYIFIFFFVVGFFTALFLLTRDLYWTGDGLATSFHIFLAGFYLGLIFIILKYWLRSGWAYRLDGVPLYFIWFMIIICSVMVIFRPEFIYDTKRCSMCGRKYKTSYDCPHCDGPPSEIRRPNYM